MRWKVCFGGASVLLAGAVGMSHGQAYRSTTVVPRSNPVYSAPAPIPAMPAPGCATPGLPGAPGTTVLPYGSSVIPPSTGSMLPGSTIPSAPGSTVPSAPGSNVPGALPPGAIAPGSGAGAAAAAAAAASPASGAVGERGSDAQASAAPQMLGDLISNGFGTYRPSGRGTSSALISRPNPVNPFNSAILGSLESNTNGSSSGSSHYRTPLVSRSGIKIAENESPRPIDRVFATYNYFNNVLSGGAGDLNLHRGLIGFEKTFLDGNASIGMRLPFIQGTGAASGGTDGFGDVSLIGKYAFYNDVESGNLVSGGLVISAPTGITARLYDGSELNSVLFQPWAGFILNVDNFYTHGFTGVIIPTDSRDVTLYSIDLGVGYRLYQTDEDRLITAIIPTFEGHFNTPFSNAGPSDLVYFPEGVFLTGGFHFGLCNRAWFTLGAVIPVTGPQLYDVEFMGQLNVRF
ncbi:MAG: hypothetical protein U0840_15415 [Gemmataceae bacterium]